MRTLYITDLDGTLLGADSRVSSETERIITRLPENKLFTIATARTPATVDLIIPESIGPELPAIVLTGAALWNRRENRYSDVKEMDYCAVEKAEEAMLSNGIAPFTYTLDHDAAMIYAYGRVPEGRSRFEPLTPAERKFVDERRNLPLKKIIVGRNPKEYTPLLVFGIGPMNKVEDAARQIVARIDCSVSLYHDVFNPDKGFVEVFAPGVSKGAAALSMKKRVGADRLVVFGDSHNDKAMLEVADVAVVVDNAPDEVKEVASVVIGPNTDSSVAKFIENDC